MLHVIVVAIVIIGMVFQDHHHLQAGRHQDLQITIIRLVTITFRVIPPKWFR